VETLARSGALSISDGTPRGAALTAVFIRVGLGGHISTKSAQTVNPSSCCSCPGVASQRAGLGGFAGRGRFINNDLFHRSVVFEGPTPRRRDISGTGSSRFGLGRSVRGARGGFPQVGRKVSYLAEPESGHAPFTDGCFAAPGGFVTAGRRRPGCDFPQTALCDGAQCFPNFLLMPQAVLIRDNLTAMDVSLTSFPISSGKIMVSWPDWPGVTAWTRAVQTILLNS
jgi:hypothetical protein